MNSIIKDVEELKDLLIESEEYKNYNDSLKRIELNKEINEVINNVKKLQKEIVNKTSKKEDTKLLNKELNNLYDKLFSISEYKEYIDNSKKLNELITSIQKNFEKYFNSLIS